MKNLKKAIILITAAIMMLGTAIPAQAATAQIALKSIKLNSTSATLNVGKTTQLKVTYNPTNTTVSKTVTWKTSNSAVATVSGGKVTGKKAGVATITAKVGTKTATCKVTVKGSSTTTKTTTSSTGKFVDTTECYKILANYRSKAKVKAYTRNTTLENYAKTRAKELVKSYSHTRPNGNRGLSIIPGNLFKGENIAKGQKNCSSVMTAWYNSAGHKRNMLDTDFTKVGIAGYELNGVIYWVQLFSS